MPGRSRVCLFSPLSLVCSCPRGGSEASISQMKTSCKRASGYLDTENWAKLGPPSCLDAHALLDVRCLCLWLGSWLGSAGSALWLLQLVELRIASSWFLAFFLSQRSRYNTLSTRIQRTPEAFRHVQDVRRCFAAQGKSRKGCSFSGGR